VSQSLSRALRILAGLGDEPRSLDDLAGEIGVHKTTVLRLLRTLEAERFVRRVEGHRYTLGSRLFALADAAGEQYVVRRVAAPYLRRLNRSTGQTVHLAAYENGQVVYVDKLDSAQSVRMYSRIGVPAPPHCTAVGKVLLAARPDRDALVAELDLALYTERTITDPAKLRAELARVAQQGWAKDHAEHEPFVNCVAAPVTAVAGRVVAAVSVSVPDVLLGYRQVLDLVPDLRATAAAISADYSAPGPDRGDSGGPTGSGGGLAVEDQVDQVLRDRQ
jgi:DNA-binding IclR family transcriptional regulator